MRYARVLLEHCSSDTRQLFIDYYTRRYRPKRDVVVPDSAPPAGGAAATIHSLASFIPLPYMNPANLISLGGAGASKDSTVTSEPPQAAEDELAITYEKPKPRTAFSSFVDHPDEFIQFLEACLKADGVGEEDKVDLYTTLFEMYLHKASGRLGDERAEWESKAKRLIEAEEVRRPQTKSRDWCSCSHPSRFQSTRRTSSSSRTYQTSGMGPSLLRKRRAFGSTSSVRIPRPTTLREPSRH